MLKEEGRLFFCTARGKDFYKELLANSTVAVTGLNDKWQTCASLCPQQCFEDEGSLSAPFFQKIPDKTGNSGGNERNRGMILHFLHGKL